MYQEAIQCSKHANKNENWVNSKCKYLNLGKDLNWFLLGVLGSLLGNKTQSRSKNFKGPTIVGIRLKMAI